VLRSRFYILLNEKQIVQYKPLITNQVIFQQRSDVFSVFLPTVRRETILRYFVCIACRNDSTYSNYCFKLATKSHVRNDQMNIKHLHFDATRDKFYTKVNIYSITAIIKRLGENLTSTGYN